MSNQRSHPNQPSPTQGNGPNTTTKGLGRRPVSGWPMHSIQQSPQPTNRKCIRASLGNSNAPNGRLNEANDRFAPNHTRGSHCTKHPSDASPGPCARHAARIGTRPRAFCLDRSVDPDRLHPRRSQNTTKPTSTSVTISSTRVFARARPNTLCPPRRVCMQGDFLAYPPGDS